jgi:hypothetical protein
MKTNIYLPTKVLNKLTPEGRNKIIELEGKFRELELLNNQLDLEFNKINEQWN